MSEWKIVRTVGTEEEAALAAGFLEAAGIEARVESLRFHQEPVNFGKLGEVRVLVAEERAEEAERVLAESDSSPAGDEPGS